MNGGNMGPEQRARARRYLMSWGTGQGPAGGGTPTIVLDDPAHLEPVLASGLATASTMIFVPEDAGHEDDPGVVTYDGSLHEPGGEASLGDDFYLQIQDYATSEFMSLLGPTLVRITEEADFTRFLEDADRARLQGVIPDFATAPPVKFADVPGLGGGGGTDGPRLRLYVDADGELSTSPAGRRIGAVGDDMADLEAEWSRVNDASEHPCAVCLGGVVDEATRARELADRPWIGRYLTVLDSLRALAAKDITDVRVSGFGGRLLDGLVDVRLPADLAGADVPIVMWTHDAAYLQVPASLRTFRVNLATAGLAEALTVCGSVEAAAEHADRDGLVRVAEMFADAGVPLCAAEPAGAGR